MQGDDKIIPINIDSEMKSAYIDYSMSVIVSRALPDVRDGFKPVHRRVLYGMNELNNFFSGDTKKSARIVGEVMGKYHPHGDSSIYLTMVRMAQDWSLRYPLVFGQGNFGSITFWSTEHQASQSAWPPTCLHTTSPSRSMHVWHI